MRDRSPFDQFAKLMIARALAGHGTVRTDVEVSPDMDPIAIWFTPHRKEKKREVPNEAGRRAFEKVLEDAFEKVFNEGVEETRRELLVELFTARFGAPPLEVSAIIQATTDLDLLLAWHRLTARASFEDVTGAIRAGQPTAPSPQTG